MATVSVVIPATDAPATLEQAVAAVERAAAAPEEVIVVDRPSRLGPAAARNLGAGRAHGDVLVFVDADVEVHGDAFVRIRAAFERDAELAAVFGAYDDDPGGGGLVSDFRNLLHHHVHTEGAGMVQTFWAGLGAVRRDVFLASGGFDEARFALPSVEDIELGMRLSRHGSRILLDPSIRGKHLKRWTVAGMAKTDLLRRGVPWARLLLEHGSRSTELNLGWRHRIGTGASLVLLGALARRRLPLATGALVAVVATDRDFYRLLLRRRGIALAAAGVPLHVLHRLTGAASVPLALTIHLLERQRRAAAQARSPRRPS